MERGQINEIVRNNPGVDSTAMDRVRRAEEQLAEVGIRLGGYRLTPGLGGATIWPAPGSGAPSAPEIEDVLRDEAPL